MEKLICSINRNIKKKYDRLVSISGTYEELEKKRQYIGEK